MFSRTGSLGVLLFLLFSGMSTCLAAGQIVRIENGSCKLVLNIHQYGLSNRVIQGETFKISCETTNDKLAQGLQGFAEHFYDQINILRDRLGNLEAASRALAEKTPGLVLASTGNQVEFQPESSSDVDAVLEEMRSAVGIIVGAVTKPTSVKMVDIEIVDGSFADTTDENKPTVKLSEIRLFAKKAVKPSDAEEIQYWKDELRWSQKSLNIDLVRGKDGWVRTSWETGNLKGADLKNYIDDNSIARQFEARWKDDIFQVIKPLTGWPKDERGMRVTLIGYIGVKFYNRGVYHPRDGHGCGLTAYDIGVLPFRKGERVTFDLVVDGQSPPGDCQGLAGKVTLTVDTSFDP